MRLSRIIPQAALVFPWLFTAASADPGSPDGVWRSAASSPGRVVFNPSRFEALSQAAEDFTLYLPSPDGTFQRFTLRPAPTMHPGLAARYPGIQTYQGIGVDNPHASVRVERTPRGLRAQILSPNGPTYVDPTGEGAAMRHWVTRTPEPAAEPFGCETIRRWKARAKAARGPSGEAAKVTSGDTFRTFRLAVAAQGEYTQYHAGTVSNALAAIVTTVNRVNAILERDLAVRLQLVPNNDLIVFTNPVLDPYPANDISSIATNQAVIDGIIGSINYDVGHVFNTGLNGFAGVGVLCNDSFKAEGVSGSPTPEGDAFDVTRVAHELGHQLGADHTFNGILLTCGITRNGATAFEPGSGSTIMAYPGLCGADNLQSAADPYFLYASISQIVEVVGAVGCGAAAPTGNNPPTVSAGSSYTIPRLTPFTLTASGNDADGDPLTYCWEQMDLGPAAALTDPDDGLIPLFRSYPPSVKASRTFPRLETILSNTPAVEEKLPFLPRTMRFVVTARDNRMSGGGVQSDAMNVTVAGASGPFLVTAPNTGVTWTSGPQTVTWNVAGTDLAPVSTPAVNIRLSFDGGTTFPIMLASNTPNDGTQGVVFPILATTQARVKVEGAGNIFFDLSNTNFTVSPPPGAVLFAATGAHAVEDASGTGNNNGALEPGESNVGLFLELRNAGGSGATAVSGWLESLTPTATIVSNAATFPDLPIATNGSNDTPFVMSLDPDHPCGDDVLLRLWVDANEGGNPLDFSLPTGLRIPVTNAITTNVWIPDGGPQVNIPFEVPAAGSILDVDFSFDGTVCDTDPASAAVGLNHPAVGELTIQLSSPEGTFITLMSFAGNPIPSRGTNLCDVVFDDDGAFPSIQSIDGFGADSPHTGTYLPDNPLSGFDGEEAMGTWTLSVLDGVGGKTGRVNRFSLVITTRQCDAPASVYTITVNPAIHGSVTPSGAVAVVEGGDQPFSVTADPYYFISDIFTNGFSVGLPVGTGVSAAVYTWSNVTADGVLQAAFGETLLEHGTPEWWLASFGLTNALGDTDGDGKKAWEEYFTGTIPTNGLSVFRVSIATGFVLSWPSVSNRWYDLERSTNRMETFVPLFTNLPGMPPENCVTDSVTAGSNAYYRVRAYRK